MAEIALDDLVRHAKVQHTRSDSVAELVRLEAEQLAVRIADIVVICEAVDSLGEGGLGRRSAAGSVTRPDCTTVAGAGAARRVYAPAESGAKRFSLA